MFKTPSVYQWNVVILSFRQITASSLCSFSVWRLNKSTCNPKHSLRNTEWRPLSPLHTGSVTNNKKMHNTHRQLFCMKTFHTGSTQKQPQKHRNTILRKSFDSSRPKEAERKLGQRETSPYEFHQSVLMVLSVWSTGSSISVSHTFIWGSLPQINYHPPQIDFASWVLSCTSCSLTQTVQQWIISH